MAQHWLDVTRYADSSGLANDFERGNAWRYRDYVVRALNNDKPYDQFIVEQIAGDEVDSENPEAIIATGFLRMGPWELTGMEVAKIARQRFLDDVTNSVGEVFLAHSLQCARCHDHKFDPVPTQDYYSIQAVFATTQLAERKAAFLPEENTDGFDEVRYLHKKRDAYNNSLNELDGVLLENAKAWFQQQGLTSDDWVAEVQKAKEKNADRVFNAARSAMARKGLSEDKYPPKLVGFTPAQFGMERVARKGLQRLDLGTGSLSTVCAERLQRTYDDRKIDYGTETNPQKSSSRPARGDLYSDRWQSVSPRGSGPTGRTQCAAGSAAAAGRWLAVGWQTHRAGEMDCVAQQLPDHANDRESSLDVAFWSTSGGQSE